MTTAFDEVLFPTIIAEGAQGGPKHQTRIVTTGSGYEYRNQDWPVARGEWNIGTALKTRADYDAVLAFFRARRGRARGFRFRDWSDYIATEQAFGTGDGSTTVFQLKKNYSDGVVSVSRDIKKPVTGTVHIFKDGVEAGSGWTLDYTTGLVTFSAAPANGVALTWTGWFDVPVRFDTDHLLGVMHTDDAEEWPNIPLVELRL